MRHAASSSSERCALVQHSCDSLCNTFTVEHRSTGTLGVICRKPLFLLLHSWHAIRHDNCIPADVALL